MQPFKLERYFAEYEFSARYLLSASDCESLTLGELLGLAGPDTRRLWDELSLGYTESPGHPLLRQAISGLYTAAEPDDVLVAAPEEAIFIFMHTLLSPGDEVVAVSPAYQSLHELASGLGCRVTPWPLALAEGDWSSEKQRGWRVDLNRLESLLSSRTRLLVLNFPHNPTGCLPAPAEFEAILALAERHGVYVFSDEMYRLLEYDPSRRLPQACDRYERATSLGGMSKALALPGLRIGWLATGAPGLRDRWQQLKDYTTICSSAPSEILALIGLQARQSILDRNLEIIRANLELAAAFFERHRDLFRWLPPEAGSVAFPEWRGPNPVDQFCQDMLQRQGVMVVPGGMFDYPGSHFRLGLGRRNFPAALEQFEKGLD